MIVSLAAVLLSAATVLAQPSEAPAAPSPVRDAVFEALGPHAEAVGDAPSYAALVGAMTPEIRPGTLVKLDALDRDALSPSALTDLSRVYILLGKTDSAAQVGLALQGKTPKGTQGLVIAAHAKLQEGDYAASVGFAEQALKLNPGDRDALSVLHSAKGRRAPTTSVLPAQITGASSDQGSPAATVDPRTQRSNFKMQPQAVVPYPGNDAPDAPARSRLPWLPYAFGGWLTLLGIVLSIKHAKEQAGEFVEKTEDRAADWAANLYHKGKDFVQEHPKKTIAAGVAAVAIGAWLILPAVGLGGGGLMLATAGGPSVAATAGGVSATQVAVAGVAVAAPLYMKAQADSRSKDVSSTEPISTNGKSEKDITNDQWTRIREAVKRIRGQLRNPFPKDGVPFKNKGPGHLPERPEGYYQEYTVPQASGDRGLERIITGAKGEIYFSPDHYSTFIPISL